MMTPLEKMKMECELTPLEKLQMECELEALSIIIRAVLPLPPTARIRVLRCVDDFFNTEADA